MSPIVITEAKKIPFRMFYLSRTWLLQSRGLGPILLKLLRPYLTKICNKLVSVCARPFQPSRKFAGKVRSLLKNVAPEKCFSIVGLGLTLKH
jgi:hypothetical protein